MLILYIRGYFESVSKSLLGHTFFRVASMSERNFFDSLTADKESRRNFVIIDIWQLRQF